MREQRARRKIMRRVTIYEHDRMETGDGMTQ